MQVFAQVSAKADGVKNGSADCSVSCTQALVSYIHKFTLPGCAGLCKCEGLIHNVANTSFSYLFKDL